MVRKHNMHEIGLMLSWIVTWGLFCCFLCYRKNFSLRILWIDIKTGFRYTQERMNVIVLLLLSLFLLAGMLWMFWQVAQRGLLKMSWDIRIRQKHFEIYTETFKYAYFIRLVMISIFVLLLSIILREILSQGSKDKLESALVAHALGGIEDKSYTNSREALYYNYDLGHRAFEVDFSITSDNKLVCLHDWTHGALIQGRGGEDGALSKVDFESGTIYEKYTPISLEELLLFMSKHEDVWIVTDSKETSADLIKFEFSYIVDEARMLGVDQVLDRVVVQIYNPEMYEVVNEIYEFPSVIFTLYQYWGGDVDTFADICRLCAYKNIDIITMWYYLATPEILEIADQFGINVYVHTLNDIETVIDLKEKGVKGFYTDYLTLELLENGSLPIMHTRKNQEF